MSGGVQQGNSITNGATAVSNGLFTVMLDFGNQFPGAGRWLEIGARTNGAASFLTLAPRQQLTSTPYSIQSANAASAASANSVAAGNITGTLSAAQLPSSVVTNGASGVNFTGTFTGNGAGITNVALTSLNSQGFINWQGTFLPTVPPITNFSPGGVLLTNIMVPTNMAAPAELLCANAASNSVAVFTNNGNGDFGLVTNAPVATEPSWLAVADLNGDGKLDVVAASLATNLLTVLTNDGHGGLVFSSSLAVQTPQFCVVAADINGDGKPDLIAANTLVSNTLSVLTNDGRGGFVLSSTPVVGLEPVQVVAADINGDGKLDLMCANAADSTVSVLTNNGSGGFVLATNLPVGPAPEALAAADINGDGKLDLICANTGTNTLLVYTNNGSGGFVIASTNTVGSGPVSIQTVDLNGDGNAELVCGDANDGTLLVLTNNGASGFGIASTTTLPVGPVLPDALAVADINGDGKRDMISADPADHKIWLLINSPTYEGNFIGNGSGLSSLTASNITGVLPNSALAGTYTNVVTFNGAHGTFSGAFSGNGGGLTNLNASQLSSGTVPTAALSGTYSSALNFNNAANTFTGSFTGNGGGLTNLNASQLTTGTVPGSALSGTDGSGLVNLSYSQLTSGTVPGSALAGTYGNALALTNPANSFTGNGSGLTNLNASQLATGTLPGSELAGTYGNAITLTNPANSFTGNGGGLTNLNASQLTSGTVPDARLSANVPLLSSGKLSDSVLSTNVALRSGGNTFNGNQNITNGNVGIATTSPGRLLQIGTSNNPADALINLGCGTAAGASRVWEVGVPYGTNNATGDYYSFTIRDTTAGDRMVVRWDTGNVGIGTNNPQATLDVIGNFAIANGDSYLARNTNGAIENFLIPRYTDNTSYLTYGSAGFVIRNDELASTMFMADNGNVGIGTTSPTNKLHVIGGVSATAFVSTSDRNAKENFAPVSPLDVLNRVTALPIETWNFKDLHDGRHMGPMAQDFYAAFHLGNSDTTITTVDPDGVALAAIQGLNEKVEDGNEKTGDRMQKLETENQKLEAENADLKARLEKLEKLIDSRNVNSK